MESPVHSLTALFDQLGLASTDEAIAEFVREAGPLEDRVELHQAKCWSPAQASFLKSVIREDADWAEVVDQLNVMLR